MGTNTSSLARASELPTVLPSILSAEDSDEIIEIAERDGWNLALDSVDDQPAWEKNFAKHRIGELVVIRGIGHSSCLPAQRPSMGVMLNP
jgi:hypothetical protein